jgi:LemA protein
MNSGIGEEVKKIYGKEISDKSRIILGKGSKLTTHIIVIWIPLIALLAVAITVILFFNKFVILQQKAFFEGSRVEFEYQRRSDLIPKIETMAVEYAQHEQALFKFVADTRELKIAGENLESSLPAAKGRDFGKNLSKLMALAEQYPNLKATQSYQVLMKKIETTEDRISTARSRYSAAINKYNKTVCSFPDNIFAHILGIGTLSPYHPTLEPMPLRNKKIFFQ